MYDDPNLITDMMGRDFYEHSRLATSDDIEGTEIAEMLQRLFHTPLIVSAHYEGCCWIHVPAETPNERKYDIRRALRVREVLSPYSEDDDWDRDGWNIPANYEVDPKYLEV